MPPESHECKQESRITKLETGFEYFIKRTADHIAEGDNPGGYRDRLIVLEQSLSSLKKAMWARVSVAGLIGGLVGSGSADALGIFLKWIMKIN